MKYTFSRMANSNAARHMVVGSAVLCRNFDPETATVTDLFGVTTGGITFSTNPSFKDWAEDVDQLPNGVKEFREKNSEDATVSSTFFEVDHSAVKALIGAATVSTVAAGTAGVYTLTIGTALAAGDSLKVAGVSYSYDSGDTTTTAQATAIAAAITADAGNFYSASASSSVVTLTEKSAFYGIGVPEVDTSSLSAGSATLVTTTEGKGATYKIKPNDGLSASDFQDVWIVGDTSAGGFIAIHLKNALNTSGFQIKTSKDDKAQFAFEFHAHYSLSDISDIPYEIFIRENP